jgi:signal transduction histidine kinase
MVRSGRWLLFLLLTCAAWADSAVAQPQNPSGQRNILILHAFEANMPINVKTDQGLGQAFEAAGLEIKNQFFEYLDLVRNPGPEHRARQAELLRVRHGRRKIDLIITLYAEALQFVLEDGRSLFPDAPVLALYLPAGVDLPKTDRRVIPHSVSLDMKGTLAGALTLLPGARRIWIVSDVYPGHRQYELQARRTFKEWESRLEFRYLSNLSVDEMLAALSHAPPDTIVLYIEVIADVTGKTHSPRDVAERLSQASTAPIFGLYDTLMGSGIVGGSLASFEQTGSQAGRLALNILASPHGLESAPAVLDVPPMSMFDGRRLKHWNLSVRAVPPGSVVLNREYTLWDFRLYVLAALGFIVAGGILIGVLLTQRREKKRAEAARLASEALSSGILASLPSTMAIVDRTGTIVQVNRPWHDFPGAGGSVDSTALGVGMNYLQVCRKARERDPLAQSLLEGTEAVLAGRQHDFHVEYPRFGPRGDRWFSATVSALERPEGGAVISRADITSRRLSELELEHLRRDLAHMGRVTLMGQLAASLAHELNQPLTAIVSNAQAGQRMLESDPRSVAEVREILEDVAADADRAGEVIRRLRRLLRKDPLEFAPLDLGEVIREVVVLARTDAIFRRASIALEIDGELPLVRGDRVQLQQVLLNLILNGLEAMADAPPEDRTLTIRAACERGGEVLVAVHDAGMGIEKEDLAAVFAPFVTSKPGGLGMGLAITRSIVEAHGGRVWAESTPHRGTTFSFILRSDAGGD